MALDAIIVRFSTAGIPEVSSAFATVSSQARKFEDSMTATAERGGRTRTNAAQREARQREQAQAGVAKEADKLEKQQTRETEREAKRRGDIVRRSSEMAGREAKKAADAELKAVERLEQQKQRIRVRSSEMAGRAAAREAAEEMRAREKVALSAGKYAKTWGGRLGSAATMLGGAVGIGGAFAVANAARQEFAAERTAALIVNQVTTGAKPPPGANVANILGQAGAVSRDTGLDRGEIAHAGLVYAQNARRGDFAGVMGNMGFFAKLSKVTGTSMDDLASAAGTLQSQNLDLKPEQMQQLLLNAYSQSKQGSMSLQDAVKTMGITGSTRSSFAGDVTENQRQLLGFAQIAKAGGDAGEAGTFTKDIALEASKASAKFKKQTGRELFKTDEHGRMQGPEQLVLDIFKNTKGNIQQINDLMGIRGGTLFRELENSYIQGAGKKNDVAAGIESVRANLREVTGATMTAGDLDAQFQQTMSQPAEQFGSAMNKIQVTLEEQLAPALASFAKELADPETQKSISGLISAFGKLADFFIKNPLSGIGSVIALAVTKDITNAAIGQTIKGLLASFVGGGGGTNGLGAGGSVLNKVGAGVAIAAGATAITVAGMDAIDAHNTLKRDAAGREIGSALSNVTDASALARKAKNKTVTAEDIAKMESAEKAQEKVVAEKEAAMRGGPGLFARVVGAGADVAADQQAQYRLQKAALDDMIKSLKAATTALAGMKNSVPQGVPQVTTNAPGTPIGSAARSG